MAIGARISEMVAALEKTQTRCCAAKVAWLFVELRSIVGGKCYGHASRMPHRRCGVPPEKGRFAERVICRQADSLIEIRARQHAGMAVNDYVDP